MFLIEWVGVIPEWVLITVVVILAVGYGIYLDNQRRKRNIIACMYLTPRRKSDAYIATIGYRKGGQPC